MASTFSGKLYDRKFMTRYNQLSSVYADILPNDIREAIQWSQFIIANVPKAATALDKLSSVAITSLQYQTSDLTEASGVDAKSWKNIMEDKLEIEEKVKEIGFNFLLNGNSFTSVYFPIQRSMRCLKCKQSSSQIHFDGKITLKPSIERLETEKNKKKKEMLVFKGICPHCKTSSMFKAEDIVIKDVSRINIVSWPVFNMSFIEDTVTGRATYYYKMPKSEEKLIKDGYNDMIFHQPLDIIEAAVRGTSVKFDNNKILHTRRKKMNGTNSKWGMPLLLSAIPEMISLLLLRKGNERILSDMIFPLRGVTPRSTGADGQAMYNFISGTEFSAKIEKLLLSHKTNPTSIKYFPIPIDPVTAFGEGKSLNLSGEIDELTTMIMTSIGVPIEFVTGGLGYSAAGASIRILENQLTDLSGTMENIANFVAQQVASYIGKEPVRIKFVPIKLVDDMTEKQLLLSLYQNQKISDHTIASMFKLDAKTESDRLVEESKTSARGQMEIQSYQQELNQDLEEKAKQEAMLSQSSTEQVNQQAIMQEADQMAQQLAQMEAGQRRSEMDRLQKDNWLLYVATKERMEFNGRKDATAAAQQAQQEQQ